jgi:hypothetical protein
LKFGVEIGKVGKEFLKCERQLRGPSQKITITFTLKRLSDYLFLFLGIAGRMESTTDEASGTMRIEQKPESSNSLEGSIVS